MKKLTKTQKTKLLKNQRTKIQKVWDSYHKKVDKIENSKFSRSVKNKRKKSLLEKTQNKISKTWSNYQISKHNKTHDLKILSTQNIYQGEIKNYKEKSISNETITKNLKTLLRSKKVRYILVVLKIKILDSEQILIVSDSFTPESLNIQFDRDENILNLIQEKLLFSKAQENREIKYDLSNGFEILEISYKVIYNENPPESKKS